MDYDLFDRALIFAARAHSNQHRKGTDVPYITHPVALAVMLIEMGCSDELIVAALLHDVIEDTPVTLSEVEAEFGSRVAELVWGVTEPDRSAPWEARKAQAIHKLRDAPLPIKLLACVDKLHNIRSLARGYTEMGDRVWERFKRGKEKQAWYHRSLVGSLMAGLEEPEKYPIFAQFAKEVENLFGR